MSEKNVVFIQKNDDLNSDHILLDVWRAYPAIATDGYAALTLTSFSMTFVSEATGVFQIEESKGMGEAGVVFANIKDGINAIIMGCKKCSKPGPQIINLGYLHCYGDIKNSKCSCNGAIDITKI